VKLDLFEFLFLYIYIYKMYIYKGMVDFAL